MHAIDTLLEVSTKRLALPPSEVRQAIRQRSGLTQREVAVGIGVDRPTVSRWESGRRTPRGRPGDAYAELLQRLVDELLP